MACNELDQSPVDSPHAGPTEVEASRTETEDPDPEASGAFLFVPAGVEDIDYITKLF